ncbi:peptidoglycan DD-metalloendopeptidase family protein [Streptomyces lichenis]|uniref:Peptidoglycan DD-metalloendopeptidase family protein n=1 Tax=Streptomyces lichenis TaxID=2306967 RepID=A0ABT0I4V0_9ACTN|nr:peptidoglycan DD-metalloendopeptidase family protein [Streptomyces lichenis]
MFVVALTLVLAFLPPPAGPVGGAGPAAEVTRLYTEAALATDAYERGRRQIAAQQALAGRLNHQREQQRQAWEQLHDRVGAVARDQYRTGGALAVTARLLTAGDPDSAVRRGEVARRAHRAVAVLLADARTAERGLARAEEAADTARRRLRDRQTRLNALRKGIERRLERAELSLRTVANAWRTARPCGAPPPAPAGATPHISGPHGVGSADTGTTGSPDAGSPSPAAVHTTGQTGEKTAHRTAAPLPGQPAGAASPRPPRPPADVATAALPSDRPGLTVTGAASETILGVDADTGHVPDLVGTDAYPATTEGGTASAATGAGSGSGGAGPLSPAARGGSAVDGGTSAPGSTGRGMVRAPGWVAPVARYALSAGFDSTGAHWAHRHTGQDFAVDPGTTVRSIGPGRVHSVSCGGPFGVEIVVRHPGGWYSQYAHLASPGVRPGQRVTAGQGIARSGSTGNSTGPHLHFEVRLTPYMGSAVHPVRWLAERGVRLHPAP